MGNAKRIGYTCTRFFHRSETSVSVLANRLSILNNENATLIDVIIDPSGDNIALGYSRDGIASTATVATSEFEKWVMSKVNQKPKSKE